MRVGIAGPVSLNMLASFFPGAAMPEGYPFPYTANLIKALVERGHEVVVFTLDSHSSETRNIVGKGVSLFVAPMRPRARHRALDFFREERRSLREAMLRSDCDVLHAHWTYEFALAGLESGLPTLVTAHDAPWSVLRWMPSAYRLLRLGMALRVATSGVPMTAVSPYVRRHFFRYMLRAEEMTVIPNGVPSRLFVDRVALREFGSAPTLATVLSGWTDLKNGETALRAFQQVRHKWPNARLKLYGSGSERRGAAEEWAIAHECSSNVEFLGPVEHGELLRQLRECVDLLVHPSLEECHPLVLVEAMAQGIPIIAGRDSGGVPWTLDSGRAGMLVDVKRADRIATAVELLLVDEERRRSMAEHALSHAWSNFQVSAIAHSYEVLYRRLLGH